MNPQVRDKILQELDALASVPTRAVNDIGLHELADRWSVTPATVIGRMKKAVDQGLYETLLVYDPGSGRRLRVYRKVEEGESQH